MKILMILESDFPPDVRVEKEIHSLVAAGHEIVLACSSPKSSNAQNSWNNAKIIKKKMPIFIYKSSVGALKFPFYFLYWQKFISEVLESEKFDAIHLHDLPLSKVAYKLSRKYQIPFVLDLHENWPALLEKAAHTNTFLGKLLSSNVQWKKYEIEMLNKADKIITVIEEMRDRVLKLGINSEKIYILPNTIRLEDQKNNNIGKKSRNFTLFYAGGINNHRGLQIVLKAINHLKNQIPDLVFQIAGDGSYKHILEDFVIKNGLGKQVKFLGWKNYDEMMKILLEADVAMIPHLRSVQTDNSSPNKLYQYAYLKKPIIASDCISVKRILTKAKCGLTYKSEDHLELAEKISELYSDSAKCKELGEAGYKSVIEEYNWENNVKSLLNLYAGLAGK